MGGRTVHFDPERRERRRDILAGALGSRIGRRVLASFVGGAMLPLVLLAVLSLDSVSTRLREEVDNALRLATKATGQTLAERVLLLETDLDLVRAAVEDEGSQGAFERLPLDVRSRIEQRFESVAVVHGATTTTLVGEEPPRLSLTAEQLAHVAGGGTVLVTMPGGNRVALVQARHRDRPDGDLVQATVQPDALWAIDGVRPVSGELCVLDARGVVLFASTPDAVPPGIVSTVLDQDRSPGRLEWHATTDDCTGFVGRSWCVFMRPRFLADWVVVHGRPSSAVLAPLRDFQQVFLLTMGIAFLTVMWLGLVQIRRTLGPIARLHEATRKVALGDLSVRVDIARDDEFGALGRSFNEMTSELIENIQRRERTERELVAARDEALAAVRTEAMFLTNVSHELRTPLTGILSSAEILDDYQDADPETRREFTQVLVEQARNLARLVDDVLEISRLGSQDARWVLEPTDVSTSVDAVIAALPESARCRTVLQLDGDLPRIAADAGYLRRLWGHLVDNALKFSPADAPVVVRAFADRGGVTVEVQDQGPGIAPADQDVIFERFRQAGRDIMTEKASGTGLGLALAKSITLRHGGRIGVDSDLGRGATFRVWLPACAAAVPVG